MQPEKLFDLSIVTSTFHSEVEIDEFLRLMSEVGGTVANQNFEIIVVDDGSTDTTRERLAKAFERFIHLKVVFLSRNFGQHQALLEGLSHVRGERVFLIESDLEEDPKWLRQFIEIQKATNVDVVFGVQQKRRGDLAEKWLGQIFYNFLIFLLGLKIPRDVTVARLMTRKYVDALLNYHERNIFLLGLWHAAGFRQIGVDVIKGSDSKSTYTFKKKVVQAIRAVTSFSARPLYMLFMLGFVLFFSSMAFGLKLVFGYFIYGQEVAGYTSIMTAITFFGGFSILAQGIVGIYVSQIFEEVKGRPRVIVSEILKHEGRNK